MFFQFYHSTFILLAIKLYFFFIFLLYIVFCEFSKWPRLFLVFLFVRFNLKKILSLFFYNFVLQHCISWELIIFGYLIHMIWIIEFGLLNVLFFKKKINIFFIFIIRCYIYLGFNFVFVFFLFSIYLFQFHHIACIFVLLSQVNPSLFFFFNFYSSNLIGRKLNSITFIF